MEEQIKIFEEIRSYILGELTSEEAAAFEEKLAKDENLRREYENIRQVGHAVTKMHSEEEIRAFLEKKALAGTVENSVTEEDLSTLERELAILEGKDATQEVTKKRFSIWNKIVAWFVPETSASSSDGETLVFNYSYASRLAVSFAVAASIALAVFLPIRHGLAVSGFDRSSMLLAEVVSSDTGLYRGDSDMESKIEDVYDLIREDKTGEALDAVTEMEEDLQKRMEEEDVIQRAELEQVKQDVEWYKALLLMQEKKVHKAKMALKDIVKSEGKYAAEAKRVLEEVY